MQHTPTIKIGDRVRIMQTNAMVFQGWANVIGRVVGFNSDGLAIVKDGGDTKYPVPSSALMKA
jgi:hypothetical protein